MFLKQLYITNYWKLNFYTANICTFLFVVAPFFPVQPDEQMFCGMRSSHKFYSTLAAAAFAEPLPLTCTDCVCLCTWRLLLYLLQPAGSQFFPFFRVLPRFPTPPPLHSNTFFTIPRSIAGCKQRRRGRKHSAFIVYWCQMGETRAVLTLKIFKL